MSVINYSQKGNIRSNYDIFAGGYLRRSLYLPAVRLDKVKSLEEQVNNFFGMKFVLSVELLHSLYLKNLVYGLIFLEIHSVYLLPIKQREIY